MAKFEVVGFNEVEKQLLKQSDKAERLIPQMLKAGAEVLIEAQKAEVEAMVQGAKVRKDGEATRSLGDLKKSIKASKVISTSVNATIEVYPHGKDSKGERNAEKGFVLEYGRTNTPAYPCYPWMTIANEKSNSTVHEAMAKVWEEG